MTTMRVLSLFSGIGAHDLGLQRAGMKIVGQIEIDEYCQGILEKHWPQVPKWQDITSVTANDIRRASGRIDLITGGFPCQDISVAGRQQGIIKGKKSGLWREMWRLIKDLQPAWVLIENVPAIRTKGIDRILSAMEMLDYSCWSFVVGAWAVGAPHQRNRVFIVANSNSQHLWKQSKPPRRKDKALPRKVGKELANSTGKRCERRQLSKEAWLSYRFPASPNQQQHDWEQPRAIKSEMGRSVDGTSRRLALKALGNANPPQILEVIGRAILQTNETQ